MDNWNGIISLLVACIELILLVNVLAMAEKTRTNILAIAMIAVLLIYQLFEFFMCHLGLSQPLMAYLAFADITFLPPLGLYFILIFLGYSISAKTKLIFIPAVLFVLYYALVVPEFKVVSCTVFYASYNYPLGTLYGAFYYLPIIITMILLVKQIKKEKEGRKTFLAKVLLTGYIIVSIPVIFAFILSALNYPVLLNVIESVMCKFALALALCYSFFCLYDRKTKSV